MLRATPRAGRWNTFSGRPARVARRTIRVRRVARRRKARSATSAANADARSNSYQRAWPVPSLCDYVAACATKKETFNHLGYEARQTKILNRKGRKGSQRAIRKALTTEGTGGHGGLVFSLCDICALATGRLGVMRAGVSGLKTFVGAFEFMLASGACRLRLGSADFSRVRLRLPESVSGRIEWGRGRSVPGHRWK